MGRPTVEAVLEDWRTAPLEPRMRAVLGFLEVLTLRPADLEPRHVAELRAAGLGERAIEEAIYVAGLYQVINRLSEVLDFELPSPRSHARVARFLRLAGYRLVCLPGSR